MSEDKAEEKTEPMCNLTCNSCGIDFAFTKKVEKLWRDSHKTFYCPNGHPLCWSGETEEQKELKKLKKQVTELTDKLASLALKAAESDKKVEELTTELELWRPSSKES
jgi:hypothetical protein